MSTLKVNTIQNTSAAHSSTPEQIAKGRAKAWLKFDASASSSFILDSFNISSVSNPSSGVFQVNFTTAFANANYAVAACVSGNPSSNRGIALVEDTATTSSCRINTFSTSENINKENTDENSVVFFGD